MTALDTNILIIEAGVTRLYSEDLPGRARVESREIVSPFA